MVAELSSWLVKKTQLNHFGDLYFVSRPMGYSILSDQNEDNILDESRTETKPPRIRTRDMSLDDVEGTFNIIRSTSHRDMASSRQAHRQGSDYG